MIREVLPRDVVDLKEIIRETDMFPPEMLDDMIEPFWQKEPGHHWLTTEFSSDAGSLPRPISVAYYVPEQLTSGTWNLLLIAVHPTHHGQSFGAKLLKHVEDDLRTRGERILLVETSGLPHFARTRSFYHQQGYEEEARIRDFYDAGDDKVIFRKSLR